MSLDVRLRTAAAEINDELGLSASSLDGVLFVDVEFIGEQLRQIADRNSVIVLPLNEKD